MKIKRLGIILAAASISAAASAMASDADTLGLGGLWRFQLDPMGFGKTPGSELYLTRLPETIMRPILWINGTTAQLNIPRPTGT